LQQLVDIEFNKSHLEVALRELADQTGFSIILAMRRAAENANVPITAKLHGVGLEDSVHLLANMAGLKAVLIGDLLYVTTVDNAADLDSEAKQREKRRPDQELQPSPPAPFGFSSSGK
jgi:hypothetical protein